LSCFRSAVGGPLIVVAEAGDVLDKKSRKNKKCKKNTAAADVVVMFVNRRLSICRFDNIFMFDGYYISLYQFHIEKVYLLLFPFTQCFVCTTKKLAI
jgi:hypothetical protein